MNKSGENHDGMNESVTCSDLIDARFKWEENAKHVYVTVNVQNQLIRGLTS